MRKVSNGRAMKKKMLMHSQAVGENFKIPTNEGLRIFRWYTTCEKCFIDGAEKLEFYEKIFSP